MDGIPLAIELAAARVRFLPVRQIVERLKDAFHFLTGGDRTAPERQQALHATLDWSHGLLDDKERILFRRLSLFAGGWTGEAAEKVCAGDGLEESEILDLLGRLVEKSLVEVRRRDGDARYHFLETVRQYARERLREAGESQRVRRRHLDYFFALGERAEPCLLGPDQLLVRPLAGQR